MDVSLETGSMAQEILSSPEYRALEKAAGDLPIEEGVDAAVAEAAEAEVPAEAATEETPAPTATAPAASGPRLITVSG